MNTNMPNLDLIQSTMMPTEMMPTEMMSTGMPTEMMSTEMMSTGMPESFAPMTIAPGTQPPMTTPTTVQPLVLESKSSLKPTTSAPVLNNNANYNGYDGTNLATYAQNYNDNVASIFPEVKEVAVENLIDIKPFDVSAFGQMAHTVELNINDQNKLTSENITKPERLDEGIKGTNVVYAELNKNSDNLRGVYSGFSRDSSFMNYTTFMNN
jgi:hypothetical protein